MQQLSSTRMELLARKSQLELARQGRELLEQKRTALMQELLRIAADVMRELGELEEEIRRARQNLARAEAIAGTEFVQSAAMAAREELSLEIETTNVMGVEVPYIERKRVARPAVGRGFSVTGMPVAIDEAASAFEGVVESIILQAESELRLKSLADEIQRTSRRLNALEHQLIPRLEAERDYIEMILNERERSDNFRLRLAKRLLERKHS